MKFKLLLFSALLTFLAHEVNAQCTAAGYYTQSGSTVTFYDSSSSVSGHQVSWNYGDGSTGFGSVSTHTYTTNGTYTAYLIIYGATGPCTDTLNFIVTITGNTSSCNADFTYTQPLRADFKINFNNTSTGASSYFWKFTSTDTFTSNSPSHFFDTSGTYNVCLYTYDASGNLCDSVCKNVIVLAQPVAVCNADFNYTQDASTDYKINFLNTSTHSSSYFWRFTSVDTSSAIRASHTFDTSGTYNVCLFTYDASGNLCDSICKNVVVSAPDSSSCDASFSYVVSKDTVVFYDTAVGGIPLYNFGDGTSSYGSSPTHIYTNGGTYDVCLSIFRQTSSGLQLCNSSCSTINVPGINNLCVAAGSFTRTDSTVSFQDTSYSVNGHITTWVFGDAAASNLKNPSHTYFANKTYNACLMIEDTVSGCKDTKCWSIWIPRYSAPSCNANFSYSIARKTVTFLDTSVGLIPVYNFGDGSTFSGSSPIHTYANAGTYTACLYLYKQTASGPQVCDSFCQTIVIPAGPLPCQASYYLGIDTTNSFNLYIVNNSTGTTSNTSYSWDFGDGSTSTAQYPTHQYSAFGLYALCLTITDTAIGCSSTYCDSVGLDSNGLLLKRGAFAITVIDEKTLLSTPDIDALGELSLYPNPTAGRFTIKLTAQQAEDLEVTVLNSQGQIVRTFTQPVYTGENTLQMDLSNSSSGIYFVTMRAGTHVKNIKLQVVND